MFAKDNQMTLTLRLVTKHWHATSLLWVWETISTDGLKDNKVNYTYKLLEKLRRVVPPSCQVVVLADREFGTIEN